MLFKQKQNQNIKLSPPDRRLWSLKIIAEGILHKNSGKLSSFWAEYMNWKVKISSQGCHEIIQWGSGGPGSAWGIRCLPDARPEPSYTPQATWYPPHKSKACSLASEGKGKGTGYFVLGILPQAGTMLMPLKLFSGYPGILPCLTAAGVL